MDEKIQIALNDLQQKVNSLTNKDYSQKDILFKIKDFLNQNLSYFMLTQFPELNNSTAEDLEVIDSLISDLEMKTLEA